MNRIKLAIIVLVIIFGSYLVNTKKTQPQNNLSQTSITSENNIISEEDKSTLITFGDNQVIINPTSVDINMTMFGGEQLNPNGVHIDSDNYPLLFRPDGPLHVKEISGGDSANTKLIYISRQIFSRGSMGDNHYIIIDPQIGKVVDSGYNSTFGNIHFENSCTSCALPVLLFREYNRQQQKFILKNSQHQKEFRDLLKQYEARGNKEICRINGKDYSINEAIKVAKDNEKCADQGMGAMYPNAYDNSFITVGEYKQIIGNIKKIIGGNNIEMVNYGHFGEGLSPLKSVVYYGHVSKISTSGEARFQWVNENSQKIINPDDQYAWFWAMPVNVPDDSVVTDKWVKFINDNIDSVFKITGTRGKDDCGYWGPDHCVENVDINTIEVVGKNKLLKF